MKNTMTVLPMYMHNQHDRSKMLTYSLWSKLHFFTVFSPCLKIESEHCGFETYGKKTYAGLKL